MRFIRAAEVSRGDHAVDLGDEVFQVKRLGKHLGVFWRSVVRIESDRAAKPVMNMQCFARGHIWMARVRGS